MVDCINQSRLSGGSRRSLLRLLNIVWTDLGCFIHQLEVLICFRTSAVRPPTSCTWAFPLCILVLYGELIPSSLLNWIPPPPSLYLAPLGGLIEDLRYPDITFLNIFETPLVTDMFIGIVRVCKPYFVSLPTLMATCLGITSPRWRRKRQFVGPVCGQTWVPGSITEYLIYRKEWLKKWGSRLQT